MPKFKDMLSESQVEDSVAIMWGRLNNIHSDGQMDTQTYDIIDSTILLIEGILNTYNENGADLECDLDMNHRVKLAVDAINSVLEL